MVDSKSVKYVPVLKWRKGEKMALQNLESRLKNVTLPLIELVNDEGDSPSDLPNDIASYWGRQAYLDVHYRPPQFAKYALDNVANHVVSGLDIIPVVRLDSSKIVLECARAVAGMHRLGYAIRIVLDNEMDFKVTKRQVDLILSEFGSNFGPVDLILDFGYLTPDTKYKSTVSGVLRPLGKYEWRRVVISAGTFPSDLMEFKPDGDNFIERLESKLWHKHGEKLSQKPIYSDYTVRYPMNVNKNGRGSKSIRYSLPGKTQVFRGTLDDLSFKYMVHSMNIRSLYGDEYPASYSWGDKFIHEKAEQLEQVMNDGHDPETYEDFSPGGSTDWVAVSVNHHIKLVLDSDLASTQA